VTTICEAVHILKYRLKSDESKLVKIHNLTIEPEGPAKPSIQIVR
jgi:hypothetical protein